MPQTINTNLNSLNAQKNLSMSQSSLATSMQRLSSGLRVNSAADDSAGLSIAERMTSQVRGMAVASRNAPSGAFPGWASQMTLTVSNSAQTVSNLVNFPVLVKLTPARVNNYTGFAPNGADLRFADANGTPLDYEIEQWNPAGESFIWVRVPLIPAGSSDTTFKAVWGNASAADAQNPRGVWSHGFVGVYHLNQTPTGVNATPTYQNSASTNFPGRETEIGRAHV